MTLSMPVRLSILLAILLATACTRDQATAPVASVQLAQLAQGIARGDATLDVEALSQRIIAQHDDYLLFDLRPAAAFGQGHIKTARNLSATELLAVQGRARLPAGSTLILYSHDSDAAAQTATLLRLAGHDARFLSDGYLAWQAQMVNVSGSPGTPADAAAMARRQAVACWFEGDYVASADLAVRPGAAPVTATHSKGYVPPLEPLAPDTLGLGLGLGLGPAEPAASQADPQTADDSLGLGLGLGLGPEGDASRAGGAPAKPRLLIGEGC